MESILFAKYDSQSKIELLEANCDMVERKSYHKQFNETEREMLQQRNVEIDLQLRVISDDEKVMKEDIKNRRKPLLDEKASLLQELKEDGKRVEGKLYKFVNRDEGMVGYYDGDGRLVEQRRIRPEDKQVTLHLGSTGTDDE